MTRPLSFVSVGELLAPDEPDDGLRWHGPERTSSLRGRPVSPRCPGRLALCGHQCGCEGKNPSHYPR